MAEPRVETPCPYCPEAVFPKKRAAMDHLKMDHPEKIAELLSKVPERNKARMSDPLDWAAGVLLTK